MFSIFEDICNISFWSFYDLFSNGINCFNVEFLCGRLADRFAACNRLQSWKKSAEAKEHCREMSLVWQVQAQRQTLQV